MRMSGSLAPVRKGTWLEVKMLGSGGFGAVHLWKNEETNEMIALKKCRLSNELTDKHRKRWTLEVQIMHKLKHENVVSAIKVPPILDVKDHELPLLGMEYCSGGDLRKVLNEPQNCCGLREYSIRCLIRDIASAIEYLHSRRIIHRDLKPENIVLQEVDDRIVYKLIDLGYAKELDQGSVCTSFVGTLQYLAPELFEQQKYTCTVDYWSFGTLVFECITGYRPFLPSLPPVQWHREVFQKTSDDISAVYDSEGKVKFSDKITSKNNLCRAMQTYMEQWLRLMLRWDPKARGGGLKESSPKPACFHMLDNILKMKIIHLLNVAMNTLVTYPIMNQHTMLDLKKRIAEENGIQLDEQDILLATGMSPDIDKPAAQCWLEPTEDEWMVFLFRKGGKDFGNTGQEDKRRNKLIPTNVQKIVRESSTLLPFVEQKRAWAEAVHFVEEQFRDFRRMILSQRAYMLSLLRIDTEFVKFKGKLINEHEQLLAKVDYFRISLEHDMKLYEEQARNGGISSDSMVRKWQEMENKVKEVYGMREEISFVEQQAVVFNTKILELQRSPFAKNKQDDTLEDFAKQARNVYSSLKQSYRDNKQLKDHKPIVTLVVKCVMYRDKKLHELHAHLGKIGGCKKDIDEMIPRFHELYNRIVKFSQDLVSYQTHRQSNIWHLLGVALQKAPTLPGPELSQRDGGDMAMLSSFQSVMSNNAAEDSMKIMEDTKETSKMFNDMMSSMLQDHEEMTSLMQSFS